MLLKKTALAAVALAVLPAAAALPTSLANAAGETTWSLRINAGGPAFTDAAGRQWVADQHFVGGNVAGNTRTVTNTDTPVPYATERYGMTAYRIPVPANGLYRLTLRVAETWATQPGQRVFSVTAEGRKVVTDLDLVQTVGPDVAYDVTVPVRTTDLTVDLAFTASVNNAKISGIELETSTAMPAPAPAPSASSAPSSSSPAPAPSPTASAPTTTDPWPIKGTSHLYVAPTGNDSNPGTASAPLRQVNRAAALAGPGAVVHVAPGTYGPVTSTRSGTSTAPITFVSDQKWRARISAPGSTNAWTNTGSWVVIQGFEITDSKYSGIMSTASNGRFLGNHIHHMVPPDCTRGGAGIELQNYTSSNNDSIGNVVHDIQVAGDCARIHGIYYQSPNAGRIQNNIVYQTAGWGVHLWHNANTITIANNTVFNNKKGGMVIGGSLEGNDVPPGTAFDVTVTNNIVVNNGDWGIREMGRVGRNTYANNLLYGNARGGYSLIGGAVPTGTVTADPQFVNYQAATGGDYHLRAGSPAVDRGTNLAAPSYDMDHAVRPQGAAVDIGAYEGTR